MYNCELKKDCIRNILTSFCLFLERLIFEYKVNYSYISHIAENVRWPPPQQNPDYVPGQLHHVPFDVSISWECHDPAQIWPNVVPLTTSSVN